MEAVSIPRVAIVALVAIVLASLLAVRSLAELGWDVTVFGAFGAEATPTRAYAEERLGEVFLRAQQGHDGKFFFVQANDPLLMDPDENAAVLDRPLYRSQRMLYPLLAGGFGLFPSEVIIWAMLIVNVVSLGAGTWAVALLAVKLGGSPWWGLAFGLNPGFISEMVIGGAGILAGVALFAASYLLMKGRVTGGVALLALAVLAREAMLLAAAGIAIYLWWRGERRHALATAIVPLGAAATWALYLRLRIVFETGASQVEEIGPPFVGFARAFTGWMESPLDLVIGVAMMLLLLVFARRVFLSGYLLGWATLGFVALGVLFTEQVWRSYFDITRAIAPVITAFVLLIVLASSPDTSRGAPTSYT